MTLSNNKIGKIHKSASILFSHHFCKCGKQYQTKILILTGPGGHECILWATITLNTEKRNNFEYYLQLCFSLMYTG